MADLNEKLSNILFQEGIDDEVADVKGQLSIRPDDTRLMSRLLTLGERTNDEKLTEYATQLGKSAGERLGIKSIGDAVKHEFPLVFVQDKVRWDFYGDVGEMFDNELGESVESVEYSIDPGERATHDYPGYQGGIEIENATYVYKPAHMWYNLPGVHGSPEQLASYLAQNVPVSISVAFHTSKKVSDGEIDFRFAGYAEITRVGPIQDHGGKYSIVEWRFPYENAVEIIPRFEPSYSDYGPEDL